MAFLLSLAVAARGEVTIRVDPRIELLTAVQLLGGSQRVNGLSQPYRSNLLAYLEPFRDHRAVQLLSQMEARGFSFDAPPALMLHLTEPPELGVREPYSSYLLQRAGGRERLDELVAALRDFARAARFSEFLEANRGMLGAMERSVTSQLDGIDYIGKLEDYYGQRRGAYAVVVAPLLHAGGYSATVGREVFAIIGPLGLAAGAPDFGTLARLRDLLWHEFGHSFANPTVEAHMGFLGQFSQLYEMIRAEMTAQAYLNWQTSMAEHLVRAVHVRLTCRELGEEACTAHYRYERTRGFAFLDVLLTRLREYEASRDRYESLAAMGQSVFEEFPAEWERLMAWGTASGPLPIAAPRGIVKARLFGLLGDLVRESADESVYGQGLTFRYEVRDGVTYTAVEPETRDGRSRLIQLKYAAEADPELRGSLGITASMVDGKYRAQYVREGSRAEAMGFRRGDVLVDWSTVYRYPLDAANLLRLRDLPEDAAATVRIIREGETVELQVNGAMR